jgi:protein N-terminal methyltransferase
VHPHRAVDCGCGIGRISKRLLLPLFDTVDMVDVNQAFLDAAPEFLGPESSRVERYICTSLHQFTPDPQRYNVIWCQWVLGHLTDDDLVAFFCRCRQGLVENGVIFVKENISSLEQSEFDEQDSSWTRPRSLWLEIMKKAGLKLLKEQKQKTFPKDLYEVRMFALQ